MSYSYDKYRYSKPCTNCDNFGCRGLCCDFCRGIRLSDYELRNTIGVYNSHDEIYSMHKCNCHEIDSYEDDEENCDNLYCSDHNCYYYQYCDACVDERLSELERDQEPRFYCSEHDSYYCNCCVDERLSEERVQEELERKDNEDNEDNEHYKVIQVKSVAQVKPVAKVSQVAPVDNSNNDESDSWINVKPRRNRK